MIKLFGTTDRTFPSNGDKVLKATKCVEHNEDNGDNYLTIEVPLLYADDITAGRIITAPTLRGEQAFRIRDYTQTGKTITCKAWHVYYDAENYLIEDSYVVDKTGAAAMAHLNAATDQTSPFTVSSDIATQNSFRCVRKTLAEAFGEVCERWNGHLLRDNWSVAVNATIGKDNGVNIRYGKNIQSISAVYNWSDVVTKLLPVGANGTTLAEVYVYSATQYEIPYSKIIEFDQTNISQEDYTDSEGQVDIQAYTAALEEDLRAKAQAYVDAHSVPVVTYTLKASPERVTGIGDIISVKDERLGIDLLTTVTAYDYDCILGKITSVVFGNYQNRLKDLTTQMKTTAEQAAASAAAATSIGLTTKLEEATAKIWSAMGDSYVIYDGDKILVVDSLPKETAQNVILINAGGIAVGQNGINGTFNSVWGIDGTFNAQAVDVINLTASMIQGGTLTLGGQDNASGILELRAEDGSMIAQMDKDGLTMYGSDGGYLNINQADGLVGYDPDGNAIYWASGSEFHMAMAVVENEISFADRIRFIPITVTSGGVTVNDGIGIVSAQ